MVFNSPKAPGPTGEILVGPMLFCRNQRLMQSHNTDNTAPTENI